MNPAAQRAWRWFKRIAPWALAALVLALVVRQARTVEWPEVWRALQGLTLAQGFTAAGLALLSYGLYASFDLIGRRLTGHTLSIPRTLATAAISYAFNLNFGALVGGFGLRLRLYMRGGLSAPTVAKVIAHSMVTNWLGYLWVGGAVLLFAPPRLPESWVPGDLGLRAMGAAMLALALGYLALSTWSRQRELSWRGHTLALPGARLAALQALLGGASWLLIGAIVWSLFGGRIDYPAVLGALLLAAVAGVLTHVPAGLGVLEAVFVATLGGRLPATEVLATVLAYRAAYYLLPLVLALPAYAWSEAAARPRTAAAQPLPTKGI
ncbi:lysylphosphatidylglycerol synthase domain-containing protein [Hydrogenophaga sp.]|uniref:lysylphosphatidylglycerol synthase domain-containing protein n=1 Tax=Hydrogenophaga sp. TaxID=1904254 RepID=UPI002FC79DD6